MTPVSSMPQSDIPRHIAIIMDGNGRWAKSRFLPRVEGHRAGAKTVRMVVEECRKVGVRYLTLYAFSSENWSRPQDEVSHLMKLLITYLEKELNSLKANNVHIRTVGDTHKLPKEIQDLLFKASEETKEGAELDLILALSYGGRDEIARAAKRIAERVSNGELSIDEINSKTFSGYLYAPDVPDPELLIRTSGEKRISNFLLWQSAYAEFVFSSVHWPDFSKDEFYSCLEEYKKRERRFGSTGS